MASVVIVVSPYYTPQTEFFVRTLSSFFNLKILTLDTEKNKFDANQPVFSFFSTLSILDALKRAEHVFNKKEYYHFILPEHLKVSEWLGLITFAQMIKTLSPSRITLQKTNEKNSAFYKQLLSLASGVIQIDEKKQESLVLKAPAIQSAELPSQLEGKTFWIIPTKASALSQAALGFLKNSLIHSSDFFVITDWGQVGLNFKHRLQQYFGPFAHRIIIYPASNGMVHHGDFKGVLILDPKPDAKSVNQILNARLLKAFFILAIEEFAKNHPFFLANSNCAYIAREEALPKLHTELLNQDSLKSPNPKAWNQSLDAQKNELIRQVHKFLQGN